MTTRPTTAGPFLMGRNRPQTDVVVDAIKTMIATGQLAPGARLPAEKELADQLGVSRGPLREGVRALALMGVLEPRQGDGTYVTALDPSRLLAPLGALVDLQQPRTMIEVMAVRRVLEVEAAGRAALRIGAEALTAAAALLDRVDLLLAAEPIDHDAVMEADVEFHHLIADAAGNRTLTALIEALAARTVRARVWRALREDGVERVTHGEHRAILAAMSERDPDAARLRMGVHLLGVEQYLEAHLGQDADWATG